MDFLLKNDVTRRRCSLASVYVVAAYVLAGCSQYIDPNVPDPIRPFVEPEHGGEYLLYRPSDYDRGSVWPLVVVCHSSFPDSPDKQIRHWTQLAEENGFLVVAPQLGGSGRGWTSRAGERASGVQDDEARILATIHHIRAGHNISEDRIFLYGWLRGTTAAVRTGLRHPGVVRAVAVSNPKTDVTHLDDLVDVIDPYQPVLAVYSVSDMITGRHARRLVDWLRARHVDLDEDSSGSLRAGETGRVVGFFEEVIRRKPWIHIRAIPVGDDSELAVRLGVNCSFTPTGSSWTFGDGERSSTADPIHTYAKPGAYHVSVTLDHPDGAQHERRAMLKVPNIAVSRVHTEPSEQP